MSSPLDAINVHRVDSVPEAERFLTWLGERRPCIAVDTETTGLAWSDTTRLVQFGDGRDGWAVPVRDWRGVAAAGMDAVRDSGLSCIMHNAKYDMHKLENEGYPVPLWRNVQDTAIRARIAEPNLRAGLKPVCERLYGKAAVAGADLLKIKFAENKWNWATVPDTEFAYWGYGALDTSLTALAEAHYRPITAGPAYEREMTVVEIMYRAETRGMRVDPEYTDALAREWRAEADGLRKVLQAGGIKNPSSNAQVTEALKEVGWEPEEFTDTGLPKLDKVILVGLAGRYGDLATPLLRYRRLIKWCSTYLDTFLRDRDAADHIHASINTMGAKTGRMSITAPALQTLPRGPEIRNCVIPDDKHSLWSVDFSGVEMRMLAHYCQDAGLVEFFRSGGEDIHLYCAELIYGPDKALQFRPTAKNTNFSRVYGAGDTKIAATAGVPVSEITTYKQDFDARFPGVQQFIDGVSRVGKLRAVSDGEPWIRTGGGRRLVSDGDKVYALVNYLIQGTSADLFKDAAVALEAVGLGDNIIVPVHDEFVFQFPSTPDGARDAALAAETMQDLTGYQVPLTCDVEGPLTRWGQKYD